jgi:hypothetical protein
MRTAKIKYNDAMQNARKRGIAFHFTFEEWVEWWYKNLGPNWMKKRGPWKGQYVMSRYNDKGNYEPSNVRCITNTQNTLECSCNTGGHHSLTFKKKMSRRMKGNQYAKGNSNRLGAILSFETRAKISCALKGNRNRLGG